jgi:hypothetical protein
MLYLSVQVSTTQVLKHLNPVSENPQKLASQKSQTSQGRVRVSEKKSGQTSPNLKAPAQFLQSTIILKTFSF